MKHLDTSVRTTRAVRQRRAAAPVYDWIGAMIVALVVLVLLFVTVLLLLIIVNVREARAERAAKRRGH